MRPVLIGQAPGPNTDPDEPLYPDSWSSTAGRLCQLMGIGWDEYLETFDRANVLYRFPGKHRKEDKFPARDARLGAEAMRPLLRGRRVVFVGRGVADAFGYPASMLEFHQWNYSTKWGFSAAVVPHASGRSRWYNHPANRTEAEGFWQDVLLAKASRNVAPGERKMLSSVAGGRI